MFTIIRTILILVRLSPWKFSECWHLWLSHASTQFLPVSSHYLPYPCQSLFSNHIIQTWIIFICEKGTKNTSYCIHFYRAFAWFLHKEFLLSISTCFSVFAHHLLIATQQAYHFLFLLSISFPTSYMYIYFSSCFSPVFLSPTFSSAHPLCSPSPPLLHTP